ncbi:hypothetical protein KA005_81585, partial [bacterium]|nr:hypothetical protein [bacterium]
MADKETINEKNAMDLADKTGISDMFALQNHKEITDLFISDTDMEFFSQVQDPNLPDEDILAELDEFRKKHGPRPLEFASADKIKKPLFERMFGYNPEDDMPWGYERMTPSQRATMRAHLGAQNIFTRAALGATKQLKGTLQLILPESMEQYLPTDENKQEFRIEEDKFYEKRIQGELRTKRKEKGLSSEEQEELDYLNETLPSNFQRTPEFLGRAVGEIERIALASELFNMISIPGGGKLNDHFSETGRRIMGKGFLEGAKVAKNKPVITTVLNSLAKQAEQLGPNVGNLFTWGFISAEKPEETERSGATRLKEGAKMTAWAVLPLTLVPAAGGVGATRAGSA